jgi:virulence-associated protein VagC
LLNDVLVDLPQGSNPREFVGSDGDVLLACRRLPRQAHVAVKHFGNGVLLLPIDDPWGTLEAGLASFEPGFTMERQQPVAQQRDSIQP